MNGWFAIQRSWWSNAFIAIGLVACTGREQRSEHVIAVVETSEWYVYSLGVSRQGGRGYYKQKVAIRYVVDSEEYMGEFSNGPDIGVLSEGDTLLIQINEENPKNFKPIRKHGIDRVKLAPVTSKGAGADTLNAFDHTVYDLLQKNRIPEVIITN